MQLSDLDFSKTYTYADYFKWQFDERLELIKGKIFTMSPAPSRSHQEISLAITLKIGNYLKGKPCKVYTAPFDVRLPRSSKEDNAIFTVVQPDICVVCNLSKLDDRGCIGAPDIVVEILSPGNNKKELRNKYEVYEEAGVKEYWIIHPSERTFLKYTLDEKGLFQPSRLLIAGDELTSNVLPGFSMDINEIFEEN
ncbi:Uma2 family endonuclease [Mucilaginibacter sp.]|uniref:Uma2 family endonuclease n=1 Tax=Mucilaginibacter sp. TaxID=1882438 RepID=UPI00284C0A09|nr:Uma2 family endonuclease [Mucilaginibacter sp.]MDR3695233.1 Uma2 family endonuclease [Mucilaginibacter sp.]